MKITLINPYYDEKIEVLENLDYFNKSFDDLNAGKIESIKLTQTNCFSSKYEFGSDYIKVIFINPRHWAKVEVDE
ncbi:hypothetical protein [Anaerococcus rubeinfantis]|uniref:hypothetical protein n=1 Tax=Anaerococcus rubeinfantis TaxID=1720199 RepID=UPI00073F72F5|nr:hypothetical protein [Anaerococcus rubeinfantis]